MGKQLHAKCFTIVHRMLVSSRHLLNTSVHWFYNGFEKGCLPQFVPHKTKSCYTCQIT